VGKWEAGGQERKRRAGHSEGISAEEEEGLQQGGGGLTVVCSGPVHIVLLAQVRVEEDAQSLVDAMAEERRERGREREVQRE
jgi:hypothetical protein